MVVGAPGLAMEAAAKAVGEGQRREQGKRNFFCANTYISLFPGLAQVHHLLAVALAATGLIQWSWQAAKQTNRPHR